MTLPERLAQCISTCDRTDPVTPEEKAHHRRMVADQIARDRHRPTSPQTNLELSNGPHSNHQA